MEGDLGKMARLQKLLASLLVVAVPVGQGLPVIRDQTGHPVAAVALQMR